jgi:hypothetical protein
MKLRFEPDLPHQDEALEAVLEALAGELPDDAPRLQVEMETGTGKTYVYLRLVHELHRSRGWTKFVVVVPSIAIREGVICAMAQLGDHFARLYDGQRIRPVVYRSRRIGDLREFALGPDLQVLVMNIDSFNRDANLVRREHDAFHGSRPIDLIRAVRPLVLVDEPQRLGRRVARGAIDDLHPRAVVGWSATPPDTQGLVHRLDPVRAFELDLVKRIDVAPVPEGMEARVQAAVRIHLERERLVARRRRGLPRVKVLTLFFVARVADYDDDDGPVRRAFVQAWQRERASGAWPELELPPVERVHGGYFARTRGGRGADTGGASVADGRAYELIMRDKEGLLDPDEPLRFVFSHSALREGWDNPNVFVVCALNRAKGVVRRRQEIGRGLRLPVDEHGQRVRDPEVGVLTVVADEDYGAFAQGLQDEYRRDGHELADHRVGDHREQRLLEPAPGWRDLAGLALLWRRLRTPMEWSVRLDRAELIAEAVAALGPAPKTAPGQGSDPLDELQQATELPRGTLAAILGQAGLAGRLAGAPERIAGVGRTIRLVRDRRIAQGFTTQATGAPADSIEALSGDVRVGYASRLVPTDRSLHGAITIQAPWERAFVEGLLARPDLLLLVRLPRWLTVDTPLGPCRAPWACVFEGERCVLVDPTPEAAGPPDPLRLAGARALAARQVELHCGRDFNRI